MPSFLDIAVEAARQAGAFLKENFGASMTVNEEQAHDIKLELDVKSQEMITKRILEAFPGHAIFGEEGIDGDQASEYQWIIDPIDGTVNYFYNLPHFCVSIAMRQGDELMLGVIYDPMQDELWAVEKGGKPTLNGREISVSPRTELGTAMITVGFSKTKESLQLGLKKFEKLAYQVRKTRMMGSAALAMAYIACGRLDAYIEEMISLWDIAAGQILIESAGGVVKIRPSDVNPEKLAIVASNGRLPLD